MAEIIETEDVAVAPVEGKRSALRTWPLFTVIALMLYGALYVWSEGLVHQYGERNRFFQIATTPPATFDAVMLGASHAMPLDYGNFEKELEAVSGANVMNLSIEGAGILPNTLVLDYFLRRHETRSVVFFVDSFAFYSRQWNEDRLDPGVLARAPFDLDLVATLWAHPWARGLLLPYVSGFTKINNEDRFAPDRSEAELTKFGKTYRPIPQIDQQRVAYLYPETIPEAEFAHYLAALEALIDKVDATGATFIAVKPPTPARYRDLLPNEPAFDAAIAEIVERRGIVYRDFSTLLPDDANYYDTDHLNPTGVAGFIAGGFAALIADSR